MKVRGENDLKNIFEKIDINGNGLLDIEEFRQAMQDFEI